MRSGVVLAATAAALLAWPVPAGARVIPPKPGDFFLETHAALAFSDAVVLGTTTLDPSGEPAPGFGVGMHYRTGRFDLGFTLEHFSSGRFQRLETTGRVGGLARVAATIRWRYVEQPWGALYLRFSPGLGIFNHDDDLRFEASRIVDEPLAAVDSSGTGFAFSLDFGVLIYFTEHIAGRLDLGVVSGVTSLDGGQDTLDYFRTRGVLTLGVEWRL